MHICQWWYDNNAPTLAGMNINCEEFVVSRMTRGNKRSGNVFGKIQSDGNGNAGKKNALFRVQAKSVAVPATTEG